MLWLGRPNAIGRSRWWAATRTKRPNSRAARFRSDRSRIPVPGHAFLFLPQHSPFPLRSRSHRRGAVRRGHAAGPALPRRSTSLGQPPALHLAWPASSTPSRSAARPSSSQSTATARRSTRSGAARSGAAPPRSAALQRSTSLGRAPPRLAARPPSLLCTATARASTSSGAARSGAVGPLRWRQ